MIHLRFIRYFIVLATLLLSTSYSPFILEAVAYETSQQSFIQNIESTPLLLSNHDKVKYKDLNPINGSVYELLNKAQNSILMITFSLSEEKVIQMLNRKAEEGVEVQVLIDRDHMAGLAAKLHPAIKLATRRIGEGHLHHKILVVDQAYVWLGSANFTYDSFIVRANLVVGFYSPEMGAALTEEALYIESQAPRTHALPLTVSFNEQFLELYVLPHNPPKNPRALETKMNEIAKQKLISLIDEAQASVKVSICVLTFKDVSRALIRAQQRGVDVEVVVAGNMNEEAVQLLVKAGIPVKESKQAPHQKWMYIDQTILLNGSPNWSMSAFSRGDESFIVLYALSLEQQATIEEIWRSVRGG